MSLNEFQLSTQQKLQDLLKKIDVTAHFEIDAGPTESGLKINADKYVLWIYPDGADISGPNIDKRFEIYDFDTLNDLQSSYLASVEKYLAGQRE
jgi:hypothetical protein